MIFPLISGQKAALEVHETEVKSLSSPAIDIEQMEGEKVSTVKAVSFLIYLCFLA
jgi:hypothetical protein